MPLLVARLVLADLSVSCKTKKKAEAFRVHPKGLGHLSAGGS